MSSNPTFAGKTMTVNLTGVADAQQVTIELSDVTDAALQTLPNSAFVFDALIGDTNGDGFVNSADALQTRSRSGQAADGNNFRSDVNISGSVNSGDTTIVRSRAGNSPSLPSRTDRETNAPALR